jgi:cytochrome c556
MRARGILRATVVLGSVTALFVAGCASGGMAKKMTADEAIEARKNLMKEQGAAFKTIQDSAKAGQLAAIPAAAEKLVTTSTHIPDLFPQGSLNPNTSRAKPEIWQKWPEFEGNAKTLHAKATQLAATAKSGDAAATNAAVTDLGRTTCGACHNAFRGPEIKK